MPVSGKGVALVHLSGRIVFACTYFCDLVRINYNKIAGMSCLDLVYPEDVDKARKLFELIKKPNVEPFEFRLRDTDGKPVLVNIQGAAKRVGGGDVYAISATVTVADDNPIIATKHRIISELFA